MRNGHPLLLGAGRYIQAENALTAIGSESKAFGKKAFIIGGETALSITLKTIQESLGDERIDYSLHRFKGFCTASQITSIAEEAQKTGADFIIGVGGGKSLDTAKAVAGTLGLRIITVPTSAATCAACAVLSVIYSDDGEVLENMFHKQEAAAVIVDMDIIARKCPARMLASGVGDAYAKFPEIAYSLSHSDEMERSVLPSAALEIAKHNAEILLEKGGKAFLDENQLGISQDTEDTVCTNIALTAVVSALVSGGKQLAIAHSFYNAVCKYFHEHRNRYLHGELVSAAIPLQMAVNGSSNEEIDSVKNFLRSIHLPVSFRDIQLENSDKNVRTIVRYIADRIGLRDERARSHIRECMETIF